MIHADMLRQPTQYHNTADMATPLDKRRGLQLQRQGKIPFPKNGESPASPASLFLPIRISLKNKKFFYFTS